MTLIDLGYADWEPVVATRRRAQLDRRLARWVAVAAALLLCLVTLTWSVRPQPNNLRLLWTSPDQGLQVVDRTDRSILVVDGSPNPALRAYDPVDGHPQWVRQLAEQSDYVEAPRGTGVLFVATGERTVKTEDTVSSFPTATTALDAATGAELWRAKGFKAAFPATDTVLLQDNAPDGLTTKRIRVVRLTDGSEVWSHQTPGALQVLAVGAEPGRPDRVATVDDAGHVRVRRLADGAETAAGTVDWQPSDVNGSGQSELTAWGGALFAIRETGGRAAVTAYSDRSFEKLWQIDEKVANHGASSCGPVLCITDSTGITGYDWGTGAARWSAPGRDYASYGLGGLLYTQSGSSGTAVLDATTGRLVVDLKAATIVQSPDERLITLTTTGPAAHRTAVRRFDTRTGVPALIGYMDAVGEWDCSLTTGDLLVCTDPDGRLTVRALR